MKTSARRYQSATRVAATRLALLFVLLGLSGFTIYAHRAIEAALGSNTILFRRADSKPAQAAQLVMHDGGKSGLAQIANLPFGAASRATGGIITATSAAALTHNFFVTEEVTVNEPAPEPLQSGGSFNLTQFVVPGGGGISAGGGNNLTGTVGQSALGTSSGGSFSLSSGFWGGGVASGCPTITVNPANPSLPPGTAGTPYSQNFTQMSGAGTITWSISSGAPPANVTLAPATGVLSGVPTGFGTFNFTVRATDAGNCFGERAYLLVINQPCGTITINPPMVPNGSTGASYNQSFTQSGGAGTITWSDTGILPPGLTLNPGTGTLTGTPTTAGNFTFTIRATDQSDCFGERSYTVIISGAGLMFYPFAHPVRLLDTRPGQLGCDAPGAPIPGGTSRTQTAAGRTCDGLSIPATARTLTGNITTVQSGGGYLTLYPSDVAQPLVANSNYGPNEILNNVFTVGLGAADGSFKIFVTTDTHVVVDLTGYYALPGAANPGGLFFHPLPKPIRLLETRAGFMGCTMPGAPLSGGVDTTQGARLTCDGVTIPTTANAIVGNATTVNPSGPGFPYLTLFPADAARPLVASSNYLPGQVMNAPFTVGLSPAGEFKIYPTTQTDLVIDVLGYYSTDAADANGAGLLFTSLPHPVRLLETRAGFTGCYTTSAPLIGGSTRTQPARGACDGVTIVNNALAIVGNATVVNSNGGYLTFWPSSAAQPLVATSNFNSGQTFNRHFIVGLGNADGAFKIFSQFTTDLVIDVSGFFAP